MTTADESYRFSGLFEAELLLQLMLQYWKHPLADDAEFRNELVERAAEILLRAVKGEQLLPEVPSSQMNFVAAVWYAEASMLQDSDSGIEKSEQAERQHWLEAIRRTIPSCFCDQDNLSE